MDAARTLASFNSFHEDFERKLIWLSHRISLAKILPRARYRRQKDQKTPTMLREQQRLYVASVKRLLQLLGLFCFFAIAASGLAAQSKQGEHSKSNASQVEAKAAYESMCATCHGLDGRGGERGPNIASLPEVSRKTDAQLVKILADGKINAGMPSFSSNGPAKLSALVAYLRVLQGRGSAMPLPGDPEEGKSLFFGKAKCAGCHMVGGQGGFFAEDLTTYAEGMSADTVRAAIANPTKGLDPRRGMVAVILSDSTMLSGLARNEDNFSLQLQTSDGKFHFLDKSEIQSLTYTGQSPMPSDYVTTLSPAELNDLVSYLIRSAKSTNVRKTQNKWEENDDE